MADEFTQDSQRAHNYLGMYWGAVNETGAWQRLADHALS